MVYVVIWLAVAFAWMGVVTWALLKQSSEEKLLARA